MKDITIPTTLEFTYNLVYGRELFYPADKFSAKIACMLRLESLANHHIACLTAMGFKIQFVGPNEKVMVPKAPTKKEAQKLVAELLAPSAKKASASSTNKSQSPEEDDLFS